MKCTASQLMDVCWNLRTRRNVSSIEYIGTSVLKRNDAAHELYRALGFIDGDKQDEQEYYLKLDWDPKAVTQPTRD